MREKILELQGKQLMDIMIDGDILYYSNWNDRYNPFEHTTNIQMGGESGDGGGEGGGGRHGQT